MGSEPDIKSMKRKGGAHQKTASSTKKSGARHCIQSLTDNLASKGLTLLSGEKEEKGLMTLQGGDLATWTKMP